MGASRSKTASNFSIPDIDSVPASERAKAIEELVAIINDQRIAFGFRKVDPDSQGQEVLKSVAKGMIFLPEYAIRIEGHSNLAKSEEMLTAQDKSRIQKLSKNRADACARLLKAAGVQHQITCVGLGCSQGEKKGCVRLVLDKTCDPTQPKVNQSEQPEVEPSIDRTAGSGLQQTEVEKLDAVVDSNKPDAAVEMAGVALTTDKQVLEERTSLERAPEQSREQDLEDLEGTPMTTNQVLREKSSCEKGPQPSDPREDDGIASDGLTVIVEPEEECSKKASGDPHAAVITPALAPASPWFITCCSQSAQGQIEECTLQGVSVKQLQLH